MCGIAGYISFNHEINSNEIITRMLDSIQHRGPDGRGHYIHKHVALGHVRLSIIDVRESANQPMFSEDENYIIVFNGEIYNYKELRASLLQSYHFKTQSDTEVILALYQLKGKDSLAMLNGMFSFIIYDKKKQTLFGARDRYGIKPFYYFLNDEFFVFCSEIKGVLHSQLVKAEVNEKMLYDFIVFNRTDHTRETCFQNIFNLLPAHQIEIDIRERKTIIRPWYFLPEIEEYNISLTECAHELRKRLQETIRLHLVSDVEVGVALSGGIDSSVITSLMREEIPQGKISSFSAVYDRNWEKDETKYIEAVAVEKNLQTHFCYPTATSLLADIDKMIYQQEEPLMSASTYASWRVYELSRSQNIKVLLNGQGADEIFAYDYMAAFYFYELFRQRKFKTLFSELKLFIKKQPTAKFALQLFVFLLAPEFLREKIISFSSPIINKSFHKKYSGKSFFIEFFNSPTLNHNVKKHFIMKLHHQLRIEDKNSMKFGVEVRVPYLEVGLVDYSMNIPSKYKVLHGEVKYILKYAVKDLLPKAIFQRTNKVGFETPTEKWMREPEFIEKLKTTINMPYQPMEKYLNIDYIKKCFQEHISGKNTHTPTLWKYFYLTRWHQLFFE
jgi:asparagine synthase (glutamine-hydrolysing)